MFSIIGVILSFVIIIVMVRKGFPMGGSMFLATICVAFFSQMPMDRVSQVFGSISHPTTIQLVLTVVFIGMFIELLRKTDS